MTRLLLLSGLVLLVASPATAQQVEPPLRILVTNDDGVSSEGIAALVAALSPMAEVVVSAPAENHSGGSQAVTLFSKPVEVETLAPAGAKARYSVRGTPTDSAIFGLLELARDKPFDMVVSGVNKGENVGGAVPVSGTIGAARQAAMMGVPAIAVSQQVRMDGQYDFTLAARYTAQLVRALHGLGDKAPRLVSVNVPTVAKGVRLVPAGGDAFTMKGFKKIGENGPRATYRVEFAMGGEREPGSDSAALADGYITVTALDLDFTDRAATKRLRSLAGKAARAILPAPR